MDKEKINTWMDRIRQGIEYRKKYGKDKDWESYAKMYRGDWGTDVLPVNKMFSYIRSMVPRVYFNSPRVCVTPLRPELVYHAKAVEAIDNMLIKETMLKETLKMSILDGFLCGTGPIKLGFDSEFGYNPEQALIDGETATQLSTKTGKSIEYKSYIKPGTPWALRAHPSTIIVPWGSQSPHSLPWICHYIIRPIDDIRQDSKFNSKRSGLKGTRSPALMTSVYGERARKDGGKDIEYGELFEIRDYKDRTVLVISENECILNPMDDPLQVEELNYEFIIFNRDPEFFWGIPDARIIEPRQKELNEVKTQIQEHRQIQLLKFLARKGDVDETEIKKFLSGEVGPFCFVNENVENIGAAIMQFTPQIPVELYNEVQAILQDMREELGFDTNQGAQYSPGTPPTATESMIVDQAFNLRQDERKDIVSDVMINIVRKWNQFIFKFWSEERIIRIVTPEGPNAWIKYTGEELAGEYFLHLDPDTGIPMTRMLKYQLAKELYGIFGGDQFIDPIVLRQMLINHYASVDPLADQLIKLPAQVQFGEASPEEIAAMRQPQPMMQGRSGKQSGGGQQTLGSPDKPMELGELQQRLQ